MSIEEQMRQMEAFKRDRLAAELKGDERVRIYSRGFEWALIQLRNGHKVQRRGWNGKNMYITLQEGYPNGIPINANTAQATGIPQGTVCAFSPYIMMKTADLNVPTFVPWVPSQTDLLSLDWDYYTSIPVDNFKEVVD